MNAPRHLLSRDGHLTMLTLDRYDVGELDAPERGYLEDHLQSCGRCRERHAVVARPALVPPTPARQDLGSATIASMAATSAFAIAAGLVAALATSLWPSPRVAQQAESTSAGVASAYTSVAQEYSDPPPVDLDVAAFDSGLTIETDGTAFVAVVVLSDDMADGTGGVDGSRVLEVLQAAAALDGALDVEIPGAWTDYEVVVLACPEPLRIDVGEPLDDAACVTHSRAPGDAPHDS